MGERRECRFWYSEEVECRVVKDLIKAKKIKEGLERERERAKINKLRAEADDGVHPTASCCE